MKLIETIEDLYAAIDEMILVLRNAGQSRLAELLDYRLRHVAWTTQSELLEALKSVLEKERASEAHSAMPQDLRDELDHLSFVIDLFLTR